MSFKVISNLYNFILISFKMILNSYNFTLMSFKMISNSYNFTSMSSKVISNSYYFIFISSIALSSLFCKFVNRIKILLKSSKAIMAKQHWKPGTMVYPIPAVMVSCGSKPEDYNIITIAWTGTVCSDPAMCYISVRKNRHSYDIIKGSGEFVINLTTKDLAFATDWCGVKSGKDFNKFEEMKLTPAPSREISAPIIEESPLSIECKVKNIVELGSHDMFIAEVVNVQADERYINEKTGKFLLSKARPIAYSHGYYFELGKLIGQFGHSVMKKKTREIKGKKGKVKKA